MSSADDIQAMLDDVYGVEGVPATWTTLGGTPVAFTAILGGGDQAANLHGATFQPTFGVIFIRARAAELAALTPGVTPAIGDTIALLDDYGAVIQAFVVTGAPRREDPRRLEWTLDIAEA